MYTVRKYINDAARQFSITARKETNAHLREMSRVEGSKGFTTTVLANNIASKADANAIKREETGWLEAAGYERVTRESLF